MGRCVLGFFLLCFIVVSAKLHKRRRRRQYLQAELKAEAKRAAAMAMADGVHDLSQLSEPQVSPRAPPSRPRLAGAVSASVCICNALYPSLLVPNRRQDEALAPTTPTPTTCRCWTACPVARCSVQPALRHYSTYTILVTVLLANPQLDAPQAATRKDVDVLSQTD